jgi:hypothetical protein
MLYCGLKTDAEWFVLFSVWTGMLYNTLYFKRSSVIRKSSLKPDLKMMAEGNWTTERIEL